MIQEFFDDVRYAGRGLRRSPATTAVLVLTLALGIGANSAVFSVLQGVLFRPLPYEDPEELVSLRHELTAMPDVGLQSIPGPDLLDYAEGAPSIESMGSVFALETNLEDDQGAARVTIAWVTPALFDVLGTEAAVGRMLDPSDWTPRTRAQMEDPDFQPPPMPVLLAHALWLDRFGGDRSLVGQSVVINGTSMTVLGVLPPDFRFHLPAGAPVSSRPDAVSYMPLPLTEGARVAGSAGITLARIADGESVERARSELERVNEDLRATYAEHERAGSRVVVEPLLEGVVGEARPFLWVLSGAMVLVLLIAVVSIANLMLVRASAREREFAVRTALGVQRNRIVRLLLTESLVVSALGAVAGLALAWWGVEALVAIAPDELPRIDSIRLDRGVLLFTLVLTTSTALVAGLAPAAASWRIDASSLASDRGVVGAGRRGLRVRSALIVGELALSLVLLAGAGLLLRSFGELKAVDPGYDPGEAIAVDVALPFFTYRDLERRRAFFDDLVREARSLPGVYSAGLSMDLPLTERDGSWVSPYAPPGGDLESPETPRARVRAATPGFFDAIGARLREGRDFDAGDRAPDAEPVIVVDRHVAQAAWPGGEAVGRTLDVWIEAYIGPGRAVTARVVGVVEPIRYETLVEPGEPHIWIPFHELAALEASLVLRGPGDPATAADDVRAVLADLDPGIPVFDVRPLSRDLGAATARNRYALALVGIFALGALAIAAVGLYGVVSTSVQRRTREIGLRLALGAGSDAIRRMVLVRGVRLAVVGTAVGLVGALLLTPMLRTVLYQVAPTDIVALAGAALLLGAIATGASWLPARSAARMDPVDALRTE